MASASRSESRDAWIGVLAGECSRRPRRPSLTPARCCGFSPPAGPALAELADELLALAEFVTRRGARRPWPSASPFGPAACCFDRETVSRLAASEIVADCLTVEEDDARR